MNVPSYESPPVHRVALEKRLRSSCGALDINELRTRSFLGHTVIAQMLGLPRNAATGCIWRWWSPGCRCVGTSWVWWGRAARQVASASSLTAMDLTSVIETRAGVRSGKPCFVGTRIAVYDVLDYLASGMTVDEIVVDFPELTAESVRAAIEFAAMRERRLATPA